MNTHKLLDVLLEKGHNDLERLSLMGMIARAVELYGIERYWEGVCGTAVELPEDIQLQAKRNAQKATTEQFAVIEACALEKKTPSIEEPVLVQEIGG